MWFDRAKSLARDMVRLHLEAPVSVRPGHDRGLKYCLAGLVTASAVGACVEVFLTTDELGIVNGLHPVVLLSLPLVIAALLRRDYGKPFLLSERVSAIFLFAYIMLYTFVLTSITGKMNIPVFLAYFTYGTLVVRSLSVLNDRHIPQLLFLSIGLVLITCILSNRLLFAVLLPVYLFFLLAVLLLFSVARHRNASSRPSAQAAKASALPWKQRLLTYMIFVLVLTVGLFYFLPRPYSVFPGLQGGIAGASGGLARLSRSITYRDMVNMAGSNRIAFTVRFWQPPPTEPVYWRGTVLTETDGRTWRPPKRHTGGSSKFVRVSDRDANWYWIHPHRLSSKYLYVPGYPLRALGHGRKPLLINSAAEVIVDSPFVTADRYVVKSVDRPVPVERRLPESVTGQEGVTPRLREIAREWTQGATTRREKALAIRDRLRDQFTYRLSVEPPGDDVHPMEHFLLETRSGHCEYFAGATVLLLRSIGIPARVVEGFMGMEATNHPREFIVRFGRAHAWTEAVLDDQEYWTRLDSTPPGSLDRETNVVLKAITDWYDRIEYRWIKRVVNFDRSDQAALMGWIRDRLSGDFSFSVPLTGRWAVMGLAGLMAAIVGLVFAIRAVLRARREKDPSLLYLATMRGLVRRGVISQVHSWHERNTREILRNRPDLAQFVRRFMDAYLEKRFRRNRQGLMQELLSAKTELLRATVDGRPHTA